MKLSERIALVAVALAFAPALLAMLKVWFQVDYYSHGFLVPFVAFWIAHQIGQGRRPLLEARDARSLWIGSAALVVYAAGLGIGSVTLQGVSVVAVAAAAVVHFFGISGLRALAFPVGFLIFMVPLPDVWLTPVIVELQLVVSGIAGEVLSLAGVTVLRDGNVLVLPGGISLFVAEACSGITSIVTLTPLAVVLAHLSERSFGRRLVIVASVVPLAMLGNLLRVVGTVIAAGSWGVENATEGPLHDLAGVLTFALSCAGMLGLGAAMKLWLPKPVGSSQQPAGD